MFVFKRRRVRKSNLHKNFTKPVLKSYEVTIDGIKFAISCKQIRNLRLRIDPESSVIKVSSPARIGEAEVKSFLVAKLSWVKKHLTKFAANPHHSNRSKKEMLDGESHYFLGKKHILQLVERGKKRNADLPVQNDEKQPTLTIYTKSQSTIQERELALQNWYRQQLKILIPPLLEKWQPILKVSVTSFGIRKMKTRWGTCNTRARRIWLSLELATRPLECLEYVVVHELVHLIEKHHNQRFFLIMDQHLPDWRVKKRVMSEGSEWGAAGDC